MEKATLRRFEMQIFTPLPPDGFELAHPVDRDFEALNVLIDGQKRLPTWTPIRMKIIRADMGRRLRESDAPWLGSQALILRKRAVDAMASMLQDNGEVLPLACDTAELFVFNPTNVIDCLDESASDIIRFSSGRVMSIDQHVFRTASIGDVAAFKIPNLRVSPTFLMESFARRWLDAGLVGLTFVPVR